MKNKLLNIKGKLLSLDKPVVMGILNVTPDSFFAASRQSGEADIRRRIETIIAEGGVFVDVGGCSTRPDAAEVREDEEWNRVAPALNLLMKHYQEIPISIDTFRAEIAKRAVEDFGVALVNDISGGSLDKNMFETAAQLNVPYILTHYEGVSLAIEDYDRFQEVVMLYFAEKLRTLRLSGVKDVILDPGFGFGKSLEQNYAMMRMLPDFSLLFDCPLLIGVSRKRMIYNLLEITAEESLNGTTVLNTYSLLNGADILRVHDVGAAVEAIRLIEKINR